MSVQPLRISWSSENVDEPVAGGGFMLKCGGYRWNGGFGFHVDVM